MKPIPLGQFIPRKCCHSLRWYRKPFAEPYVPATQGHVTMQDLVRVLACFFIVSFQPNGGMLLYAAEGNGFSVPNILHLPSFLIHLPSYISHWCFLILIDDFAERPLSFCRKGFEKMREAYRAKLANWGEKSISLGREIFFSGQGAKIGLLRCVFFRVSFWAKNLTSPHKCSTFAVKMKEQGYDHD